MDFQHLAGFMSKLCWALGIAEVVGEGIRQVYEKFMRRSLKLCHACRHSTGITPLCHCCALSRLLYARKHPDITCC